MSISDCFSMSFCCTRFITAMWLSLNEYNGRAKQIFSWFLVQCLSLTMCCLVMLSSIGESNWEWQLQLAHSEILIMFQITRGPEGDLNYWVLCSWLLNRESSCDWIFETTTTPQVAAVGAHCKFSCAISEPAHDCKLQQSQIRSLIAEIHKHWHSPPPTHWSTP